MEEKKPLIYGKMIEVIKKVEHIGKTRQNLQQKFMFRGIDDVMNALHQVFGEVGVICVPTETKAITTHRQSNSGGTLVCTSMQVRYRFYAEDGSYIDAMMDGEAMDSGDKSTSKAASIAYKYLLLETFMIPTEEQKDPDYETHEVAAPTPTKQSAPAPVEAPAKILLIHKSTEYKAAVAYLATGGGTIEKIETKYTLTPSIRAKLQSDALELITPKTT
jgi:hypothetical protein